MQAYGLNSQTRAITGQSRDNSEAFITFSKRVYTDVQINADLSLEELASQTKTIKTEVDKAWPSECGNSLLKISKIDSILNRVNNILD